MKQQRYSSCSQEIVLAFVYCNRFFVLFCQKRGSNIDNHNVSSVELVDRFCCLLHVWIVVQPWLWWPEYEVVDLGLHSCLLSNS